MKVNIAEKGISKMLIEGKLYKHFVLRLFQKLYVNLFKVKHNVVKNLLAAILVLSIVAFQLSELLVYAAFKINQDYIAKNLCVEKDVEDSTCKGCCQLKKKLNKQEEQKKELPPNVNEKQQIDFYAKITAHNFGLIGSGNNIVSQAPSNYIMFFCASIFHPPEFRL